MSSKNIPTNYDETKLEPKNLEIFEEQSAEKAYFSMAIKSTKK